MSSLETKGTQQPLRTFIASDYTATRSCQILASDSKTVLYSLDCPLTTSKTHPYSQTLHAGSSVESPIIGASMLSWVTTTIKLAFGDPNSKTVQWEKMHKNSLLSLNYNHYWFGIDLAAAVARVEGNGSGSVRKEFEWKGTKGDGNEGAVGKVGNKIVRRSIKLLDKGTGEIVARFVSSGGEGERGYFEIWKDFGERSSSESQEVALFIALVILRCVAVYIARENFLQEYCNRLTDYLPHRHISTSKQPQSMMKKALDKVGWKRRTMPPKEELEPQAPPHEGEDMKDYQLLDVDYQTGEISETKIKRNNSAENFLAELDLYKNLPSIHGSKRSCTVTTENKVISKLSEARGDELGVCSRIQEKAVLTIPQMEKKDEDINSPTEVVQYGATTTCSLETSLQLDQTDDAVRKREEELSQAMLQPRLGSPSNFSTTRPADAGPSYSRAEFIQELRRLGVGKERNSTPSPHTDPDFIPSGRASELSLCGDLSQRASASWDHDGTSLCSDTGSDEAKRNVERKDSSSSRGNHSNSAAEHGEVFDIAVLRTPVPELVMPVIEFAPAVLGARSQEKPEEMGENESKETQRGDELVEDQQQRARLFGVRRVGEAVRLVVAGGATAVVFGLAWAVQMSLMSDREGDGTTARG